MQNTPHGCSLPFTLTAEGKPKDSPSIKRHGGPQNLQFSELARLARARTGRQVSYAEIGNWIKEKTGSVDIWMSWPSHVKGASVELQFNEMIGLDIRSMSCVNRTYDEVITFRASRKRYRECQRTRNSRASKPKKKKLKPRAQAVLEILSGKWMKASNVTAETVGLPCFRKENGRMSRTARKRSVNRILHELSAINLVQIEKRIEKNFVVLYARRIDVATPRDIESLKTKFRLDTDVPF